MQKLKYICLLILKFGLYTDPRSSQPAFPRKSGLKITLREICMPNDFKDPGTGKVLHWKQPNIELLSTGKSVTSFIARVQIRWAPAVWDEGQMETRPGSLFWTAAGCSGGCRCLTKGSKNCLLSAVCVSLLQMVLWWPFPFAFWIFYFTYAPRVLILHKIIINWYKLLLINMNYVPFCDLETLRHTNAFSRQDFIFFFFKFRSLAFCAYCLFLVKSIRHVRLLVTALVLRAVFPVEEPWGVFVFLSLVSAEWQEGLFPRWWICLTIAMQPLKGNIYHNIGKLLIPLQVNHLWTRGTVPHLLLWSRWASDPTHHRKVEIIWSGNLAVNRCSPQELIRTISGDFSSPIFFQNGTKIISRLNVLK